MKRTSFGVGMFLVELVQHGLESGNIGRDVDDVGGDVASAGLQAIDLGRIGRKDLIGRGLTVHPPRHRPLFIPDAMGGQVRPDGLGIGKNPVFCRNSQQRHARGYCGAAIGQQQQSGSENPARNRS